MIKGILFDLDGVLLSTEQLHFRAWQALARRAGVTEQVCLSGGVARNDAVRQALSDELNVPVSVDPLAQYFGAIGAALWAYKQMT